MTSARMRAATQLVERILRAFARRSLQASLLLTVALSSGYASAGHALSVSWNGECGNDTLIRAQLEEWLASNVTLDTKLTAMVDVRREGSGWTSEVNTSPGGGHPRRVLRATTCAELRHAVVTILGMAASARESDEEAPPPRPEQPQGRDTPETTARWRPEVQLLAGSFQSGRISLGYGLALSWQRRHFRAGISAAYWHPRSVESFPVSRGNLRIARLSAGFHVCVAPIYENVGFWVCADTQYAPWLTTSEGVGDAGRRVTHRFRTGLCPRWDIALTSQIGMSLVGCAHFQGTERFLVSGYGEVFRSKPIALAGGPSLWANW